jgi:hypothetical protein
MRRVAKGALLVEWRVDGFDYVCVDAPYYVIWCDEVGVFEDPELEFGWEARVSESSLA